VPREPPTYGRFNPARHYVGFGTSSAPLPPARTIPPPARTSVPSAATRTTTPSRGHAAATRPPPPFEREVVSFLDQNFPHLRLVEHDEILNRITTPYDADEIQKLLDTHGLADKYLNLARNLKNSFPMGDFPDSIPSTIIFPNDVSVTDNADFVNQYI
jgi:hypothetical protein